MIGDVLVRYSRQFSRCFWRSKVPLPANDDLFGSRVAYCAATYCLWYCPARIIYIAKEVRGHFQIRRNGRWANGQFLSSGTWAQVIPGWIWPKKITLYGRAAAGTGGGHGANLRESLAHIPLEGAQ